ncbi:MAG: DUF2723 domain-containing protein [Myxococcales bacterium]|nr:DUF2723 domain-containing protein [Myxococcales bacterium]
MARRTESRPYWPYLALVLLCLSLFTCTAPGRITYPDDEIVFQTTRSLVEDGSLAIPGIAKRTGERPDRANGTFGWAEGRDGKRYGIFGHALSLVAVPAYLLGKATLPKVPERWRYVVRSDLFTYHQRSLEADWLRLVVSLSNCLLTALGALLLALWLRVLGHARRPALLTALVYALGTSAWFYAGTFLSEPLSVIVLLGSALEISRWHHERSTSPHARRHLWIAAALAGLSVHVHLLNLIAIPCLLAYAAGPSRRDKALLTRERNTWLIALALGAVGLILLGLDQWWRFGNPFESGRLDHYGHWVWPFEGALTVLVAPGRSLLIYSPPIVLAVLAWPALRRRDRDAAWLIAALFLSRWLFVSCRSDWHGGWAIGPRYLVPLIPFLLVPLAGLFEAERWSKLLPRARVAIVGLLIASVLLQAWIAVHSIFQLLWEINLEYGRDAYWTIADWKPWAMPPAYYWRLQQPALEFARAGNWQAARSSAQFEALAFGAWRLAAVTGVDGLWRIMQGMGLLAGLSGAGLGWWLWRDR